MANLFLHVELQPGDLAKAKEFSTRLFEMTARFRLRMLLVGLFVCAASVTGVADGPVSPLYLTGIESRGGANVYRIKVVQSGSVINAWDEVGSEPEVYKTFESAIAVSSSIKTLGGTICTGACDPYFPIYVAEYTLVGAFVGSSTLSAVPLHSPGQRDYLYDGTTDGSHNYALGTLTRNVYSFDSNWGNATILFTLPALPSSGLWLGITYDPSNNSLWVSGHNWSVVKNYTIGGTLLSEFNLDNTSFGGLATGLALDPADQTLWIVRENTFSGFAVRLEQYSKQGGLLGWTSDPALQNFDSVGAEFPLSGPPATPQAAIRLLKQDVETLLNGGRLTPDQADGLRDKLNAATASLDRGNTRAACNQLRAFLNQVNAFINTGILTSVEGQKLINAASAIRTQIGC